MLRWLIFLMVFSLNVRMKAQSANLFLGGEKNYIATEKKEITTLHARVISEKGDFWVLEREKKILVRVVEGSVELWLRDGRVFEIPAGMEVLVGGVNRQGKNELEVPRPLDIQDQIRLWHRVSRLNSTEIQKLLASHHKTWEAAIEMSAQSYQAAVNRKIASVQRAHEQKRETEKREKEKLKLQKQEFYRRAYER